MHAKWRHTGVSQVESIPQKNNVYTTVQYTLGDKREVSLQDESALPVTKKERMQEGNKRGLSNKKARAYYWLVIKWLLYIILTVLYLILDN